MDMGPIAGESMALGVSGDGRVVVGWRLISTNWPGWWSPFRWTESDGLEDLGVLNAVAASSSFDGSRIACYGISGGAQRAYLWEEGVGITDLGTLPEGTEAVATGISSDGQVVVGFSKRPIFPGASVLEYTAFRWTEAEGMQGLGTLGGRDAYAYGASADGSVIVGTSLDSAGVAHAFRWEAGQMIAIGPPNSAAYAVSADGRVAVGTIHGSTERAFRWTSTSGAILMDTLGGSTSYGTAVSADGNVVVGKARPASGAEQAFRWDGFRSAADYDGDYYLQVIDLLDFIDDFASCQQQPAPCGQYGNPDIDGDTLIDVLDFLDFIDAFAQGC